MRISLVVTYVKGRPFAAYIHLDRQPGEKSARSVVVEPGIVADFGTDGRPIGSEVIHPEIVTAEQILSAFDSLGLERPDVDEFSPLVAA